MTEWEPVFIGKGKKEKLQEIFKSGAEFRACPGKYDGAEVKICAYCTNLNTQYAAENPQGVKVFYCKYKNDHFSNMTEKLKILTKNDCPGFCKKSQEKK